MPEELLERESELAALTRRIDDAETGRGGLVLLEGGAGSGKSALLRAFRESAAARDIQLRSAVGGELERDFGFGIVRQLLEPVVLTASEEDRARLLDGAAALAAPVVGAAPQGVGAGFDGSFAVLHGLYWLTAALAERAPLVLTIDDAHWGDEPSLQYLDFVARRASELPLLLVVATRPGEPGAPQELLARLADAPDAELVRPQPLSGTAARAMLDGVLSVPASEEVVAAARAATGGNPLLVRELARTLAATPETPTTADVEEAVPSTVTRSVTRRLARLPEPGAEIAQALAIVGDQRGVELLAPLTHQPQAVIVDALDGLRQAELLEGDPPRFVHALIRQAIAAAAPVSRRDQLHQDAARALHDQGGADEDAVLHLLAAPPLDEPWVAGLLQASAGKALAEGAPGIAATRLQRCYDLTAPGDPSRDGLGFALGVAEIRAGNQAGWARLVQARRSDDVGVAASAVVLQLTVGYLHDGENGRGLIDEAKAHLVQMPEGPIADALRLQLVNGGILDPALKDEREQIVARITPEDDWTQVSILAWERASADAGRRELAGLVERVFASRPLAELAGVEQAWALWALTIGHYAGLRDVTDRALKDGEETARRHGSRLARAFVCFARADWSLAFGSAAEVEALAREAMQLFEDFGTDIMRNSSLAMLSSGLTHRGALDEADAVAAQLGSDAELDASFAGLVGWLARAQLRLAQGRPGEAAADLKRLRDLTARFGWSRYAPGHAEGLLAVALALDGQTDEARQVARAERESAKRRELPAAEAVALRALAFCAEDGEERIALLRDAVAKTQEAGVLLPAAEVQLELGISLRRAGLRVDARTELSRARELAARAGAERLAALATEELTVAGGRPRRVATSGVDSLTPAERRVADNAAAGLSNREIAETLFVTRKTVEATLGAVYRKLDIRSRTQLPEAMGLSIATDM